MIYLISLVFVVVIPVVIGYFFSKDQYDPETYVGKVYYSVYDE